jgi:hypothetical protein
MNKRREALRGAGWLAVLTGLVSVLAAGITDEVALDYAAAYGLLFVGAGLWALGGLALLSRFERRAAAQQVAVTGIKPADVLN